MSSDLVDSVSMFVILLSQMGNWGSERSNELPEVTVGRLWSRVCLAPASPHSNRLLSAIHCLSTMTMNPVKSVFLSPFCRWETSMGEGRLQQSNLKSVVLLLGLIWNQMDWTGWGGWALRKPNGYQVLASHSNPGKLMESSNSVGLLHIDFFLNSGPQAC
jgi:hypothetical protein